MIYIARSVLEAIVRTIGQYPAECGGVLGCRGNTICRYFFDSKANTGPAFYEPSDQVEQALRCWAGYGIGFAGFIHSHIGIYAPTRSDINYSKDVYQWFATEFPGRPYLSVTTIVKVPFEVDPLQNIFPYSISEAENGFLLEHFTIIDDAQSSCTDLKEPM